MSKYCLLVADSKCVHADMVEDRLKERSLPYFRFNTDDTLHTISFTATYQSGNIGGFIESGSHRLPFNEIKSIWWFGIKPPNIAFSANNESIRDWIINETSAGIITALTSLKCKFINHPSYIFSSNNKITQLALASQLGLLTPDTIISNNHIQLSDFAQAKSSVIFKTLSHPVVKKKDKDLLVYTSRVNTENLCNESSLKNCINLFQQEIKKSVEYRVTVVGDNCFACEIHSQSNAQTKLDWRKYNIPKTPHYPVELPERIAKACCKITKDLDLVFSAIDLIKDCYNNYWFLELNPNGLWAWIEILTGFPISDTIAQELFKE